jgi:hypothetical protein
MKGGLCVCVCVCVCNSFWDKRPTCQHQSIGGNWPPGKFSVRHRGDFTAGIRIANLFLEIWVSLHHHPVVWNYLGLDVCDIWWCHLGPLHTRAEEPWPWNCGSPKESVQGCPNTPPTPCSVTSRKHCKKEPWSFFHWGYFLPPWSIVAWATTFFLLVYQHKLYEFGAFQYTVGKVLKTPF